MMVVCDGCKSEECKPISIVVETPNGKQGLRRKIITIEMAVCEKCLTLLLKRLGSMTKYHDFFREEANDVK